MWRRLPSWKVWVALLLAAPLAASCAAADFLNAIVPDDSYVRTVDVSYGSNPRQRLDVYRPKGAALNAKLPVVVFLYGGSWRSGARSNYTFIGEGFARAGYIAVIPDYRLYPEVRFPAFVEDAAAAVAWTRNEIESFGGDENRIAIAGHSAGAHSVALLALDPGYIARAGAPPETVKAAIGLAGPYTADLTQYRATRPIFEGAGTKSNITGNARADAPPFLLLHGARDTTVGARNTEDLAAAIKAVGGRVESIVYPEVDHIDIVIAIATPLTHLAPTLRDVRSFLERTLGPPGSTVRHLGGQPSSG